MLSMLSIRLSLVSLFVGLVLREAVQVFGVTWQSVHAPYGMYSHSILLVAFLTPFVLVGATDILIGVWRVAVGTAKVAVSLWNSSLTNWGRIGLTGLIVAWVMKELMVGGSVSLVDAWRFSILEVILAGAVFLIMVGAVRAMSDRRERIFARR